MKTMIMIGAVFFTLAVMGWTSSAHATFIKYHEYRAMVEATDGTTAVDSMHAWKHLSRLARDLDEKSGIGEIVLPQGEHQELPKNFRNHVTQN